MGTGRMSAHSGGSGKGSKGEDAERKKQVAALEKALGKTGYKLIDNQHLTEDTMGLLKALIPGLRKYLSEMGVSPELAAQVNNSVEFAKLGKDVLGDSDSGTVRIATGSSLTDQEDTLQHETMHNLIDHLITKELGFARGTPEFNRARFDAVIYQDVTKNAFDAWKIGETARLENIIKTSKIQQYVDVAKQQLAKVTAAKTPDDASKATGMRSYSRHKWNGKPYTEMPTVATENFVKCGYDWNRLQEYYSFSYYLLREVQGRIKK